VVAWIRCNGRRGIRKESVASKPESTNSSQICQLFQKGVAYSSFRGERMLMKDLAISICSNERMYTHLTSFVFPHIASGQTFLFLIPPKKSQMSTFRNLLTFKRGAGATNVLVVYSFAYLVRGNFNGDDFQWVRKG
jgi:hypothetical protein